MNNKYHKTRLVAKARICDIDDKAKAAIAEDVKNNVASSNDDIYVGAQQDLIVVESVLVSTGINKNDDVFLPQELASVHGTGRHKPVNLEHNDEQIVGHMIESFPTDKEGNRIGNDVIDDPEKIPASFDLTNRAVVYAYVFPQLAHDIREKASSNELFVSVEVWYKGYDYLVGDSIVRRNESTAMVFDPVLRINGGTGFVDGAKVGRALRGMLIAGVGLVKNPANEESVIKSVSHEPEEKNKEVNASDLIDEFRMGYFNSEEVDMGKSKAGKEEEKKTTSTTAQSEETTEDLDKQEEGVTGKAENSDTSTDSIESKETEEETVESKEEDVEDTDKNSATAKESDIEGQENAETSEEGESENEEDPEKSESAEDGETDSVEESEDSSKDEISKLKSEINELKKSIESKNKEFEEVVADLKEMRANKIREERIVEATEKLMVEKANAEKLVDKTIDMDAENFTSYLNDLFEMFGNKTTASTETNSEDSEEEKQEDDTEIDKVIDKAVENAEKDDKDKVDFKNSVDKDDLVAKFQKAVSKFAPNKQEDKEE